MRPKQWDKNIFVWAALLFDGKLFHIQPFLRTLMAFILFCLISGAVYIINDLVDMPKDRLHATKRNRPLASGTLNPRLAVLAAAVIVLGMLPVALWLDGAFALILYGYLVLMIVYSFWLKNIVIVDVMTIATGFVLRVAAGVVVIDAAPLLPVDLRLHDAACPLSRYREAPPGNRAVGRQHGRHTDVFWRNTTCVFSTRCSLWSAPAR